MPINTWANCSRTWILINWKHFVQHSASAHVTCKTRKNSTVIAYWIVRVPNYWSLVKSSDCGDFSICFHSSTARRKDCSATYWPSAWNRFDDTCERGFTCPLDLEKVLTPTDCKQSAYFCLGFWPRQGTPWGKGQGPLQSHSRGTISLNDYKRDTGAIGCH